MGERIGIVVMKRDHDIRVILCRRQLELFDAVDLVPCVDDPANEHGRSDDNHAGRVFSFRLPDERESLPYPAIPYVPINGPVWFVRQFKIQAIGIVSVPVGKNSPDFQETAAC
jgi:hypothetical protein